MKKYLKKIEAAGLILMFIGIVCYRFFQVTWGSYVLLVGILAWLFQMIYKAFKWQDYQKENKQNIIIILLTIVLSFVFFFIYLSR